MSLLQQITQSLRALDYDFAAQEEAAARTDRTVFIADREMEQNT